MADTPKTEKYYFDLHIFDEPDPQQQAEAEEEEPPPPTYSQEELDEARQQGHAEGKQAGRDEALSELQATMNATLETLGKQLQQLHKQEQAREHAYEREALDLVRNLLDTLFPGLAGKYGQEEMLTFIQDVIQHNGDASKIRIDLSPQEHETLQDHIRNHAPEELLEIRANDSLAPGDCRIEWQDGGAVRDQSAQLDAIREHIDAILAEDDENGHNTSRQDTTQSQSDDKAPNQEDKAQ